MGGKWRELLLKTSFLIRRSQVRFLPGVPNKPIGCLVDNPPANTHAAPYGAIADARLTANATMRCIHHQERPPTCHFDPWGGEIGNKPKEPTAQPWAHECWTAGAAQRGILLRVVQFAPLDGATFMSPRFYRGRVAIVELPIT